MNTPTLSAFLRHTLMRRIGRILIVAVLLLSSGMVASGQQDRQQGAPVHPALRQQLARSQAPVSFLVILKDQPDPESLLDRKQLRSARRHEKSAAIYTYLTAFAKQSQAPLWAWLEARHVPYRPFYIINAIEVTGDATLITQLRQRAEVARIAANPRIALEMPDQPEVDPTVETRRQDATDAPYGILYTKAPQVWAQGYRGQGIVIASQDTGVDWTHPALQSKYRGWNTTTQTASHPYNWFDPWGTANRNSCDPDPQVPCDDNGHGTHTVGTILGSDEATGDESLVVGMAPDAQWIGCRNMSAGTGTPSSYISCFEFFLAPYPQGGNPMKDGEPKKAPDIINNSWYCPPSEGCDFDSLTQVVETVRAAGQMVIASAGNHGPGCATIRYPISAYPEVFSVGAHNNAGAIASFSSRGPVIVDGSGRLKPEIVAPGYEILSTFPGGSFGKLSGTSMASPHVAGAVALLWSAAPHLSDELDETEQILLKSATPALETSIIDWSYNDNNTLVCKLGSASPNYTYGYGRLDVASAVEMALAPSSLRVMIAGSESGPIVGATVVVSDTLTEYTYQALQSDANGEVNIPRIYAGEYIVQVEWQGQMKQQPFTLEAGVESEVSVLLNTMDLTATPTPTGTTTPTSTPTATLTPNNLFLPNVESSE